MAIIAVAVTSREGETGPIERIWPFPAKLHVLTFRPVISKSKEMHFVDAVACYRPPGEEEASFKRY